jgi:hypothetical protein
MGSCILLTLLVAQRKRFPPPGRHNVLALDPGAGARVKEIQEATVAVDAQLKAVHISFFFECLQRTWDARKWLERRLKEDERVVGIRR